MTQGNFGKNRPHWAASRGHGPKDPDASAMLRKRTSFGDFTPGNGRVQCSASTRAGERCRNDALHGATRCRVHGGARWAMHHAPEGTVSTTRGRSIVRRGLAAIGSGDMSPDIPVFPVSPVDRGALSEAHANRLMSPSLYSVALTARVTPKPLRERKQRK